MRTQFGHIQLNVQPDNLPFYRDLMAFLGWEKIYDGEGMIGVGDSNGAGLWFIGQVKETAIDYDGPGMNHVGIATEAQADVDAVATYLNERNVALLFETPRHRPEFSRSDEHTYYQVMFETPDRILMEIVYTGPKSA